MKNATLLDRVRAICMALPDTEESSRLGGSPHFYVNGKIFSGCGEEGGVWTFGVKVGLPLQALMVTRSGITVAKYVGKYGWISVEERALQDQAELERLIRLSYDLISQGGAAKGKKKAASKKAKPAKKKAAPAKKKAAPARRAKGR
jgi:predicted DNA-binding protein (MmcQ/YjbR family)